MSGDLVASPDPSDPSVRPVLVPNGHVWLRGDSGDRSVDPGRAVPVGLMEGKVRARIFPSFATADSFKRKATR